MYIYTIKKGSDMLHSIHSKRLKQMHGKVDPTLAEQIMGWTCMFVLLANVYFKYKTETLIFIVMPCHLMTVSLLVFNTLIAIDCGRVTEQVQSHDRDACTLNLLTCIRRVSLEAKLTFSRYIGIIFAENEEIFTWFEWIIYYVEHAFTSFLGPLVLSLAGRFDPLEYFKFPLPVAGYHLFGLYMRYVLTPLSLLFWANLNHTLCSVDNDPWYVYFNLGPWYLFWAEGYLLFSCYVGIILNFIICYIVKNFLLCPRKEKRS